jgi:hypothetical protein
MIGLILGGLITFGQMQVVDGIGKVSTKVVTQCLINVGVEEVDWLQDQKWEDFQDCVFGLKNNKKKRGHW